MLLRKMKLFKWFVRNLSLLLASFMSDGIIASSQISFPQLIPPIVCILKPSITDFISKMTLKIWLYLPSIVDSTTFQARHLTKYCRATFFRLTLLLFVNNKNMILMDQFAKVYFWTPLLINKDPPAPHHAPYTYEEHHPENLRAVS